VEINVYVANLAQYNAGWLVGEWLMLPMAEDALQEAISEILGDDEEIAIHDYESFVAISEYENPYKLNEMLHQLKPYDDKLIESLYFHFSSLEDVLKVLQSGEYSCYYDMESMQDAHMNWWRKDCTERFRIPLKAISTIRRFHEI